MIVRLKMRLKRYPSLTPDKDYHVIGLSERYVRLLDDNGEPILFPRPLFAVVEDSIPEDWIWDHYDVDAYRADPPGLNVPGFYERYFDHKQEAIDEFQAYLRSVGLAKKDEG